MVAVKSSPVRSPSKELSQQRQGTRCSSTSELLHQVRRCAHSFIITGFYPYVHTALPRQNAMDPTAQNYPSAPGYHYQPPIYRHENFSPNPQSPLYHHDIPANWSLSQSDFSQAQYSETGFTHDTQVDFSRLQYGSSSQDSPVLSHGQKARPYRLSQAESQGSPSLPRGYVMPSKSASLPRSQDGADSPNPEFLRSGSLSSHIGKLNVGSDMEADPGGPCSLPTYEHHPISHYESQLTAEEKDRPITNT